MIDTANENVLTQTDGAGATTKHAYDLVGRQVETVHADGQKTTVEHTVAGPTGTGANVTVTTAPNGYANRTVTDALGREIRAEDNYNADDGALTDSWRKRGETVYDREGRIVKAVDAAGLETRSVFDEFGRVVKALAPNGSETTTQYDEVTRTRTATLTAPGADTPVSTATTADDPVKRIQSESVDYADGVTTESSAVADSLGRGIASTDNGIGTRQTYRPDGSPAQAMIVKDDKTEAVSDLSVDSFGRPTGKTLTVGEGKATAAGAEFDLSGRQTGEIEPSGATRTTGYDAAGRAVSQTQADGSVFHTSYDILGRITDTWVTPKDKPEEKLEHVKTSYDTVTGKPSAVWFADDENGSKIGYAYFPDGSLKEMTYPGGKKQSWTYNNKGETLTFTDTAGVTTTYTHTDLGQIATAKTSAGESVAYGYDTLGRLNKTSRGNGVTTTVEWNDRNQPAVITHTGKNGDLVSKNTHAYDVRGNLIKTVTETPKTAGGGTESAEADYDYDTADRLTSSKTTSADGTVTETAYQLNAASDITEEIRTVTKPGGTAEKTTVTREYDADGRLIKQTTRTPDGKTSEAVQEFDANGNLLKDATGNRHTYTPAGHLATTTAPDGTTTGHTYWPTGLRKTTTSRARARARTAGRARPPRTGRPRPRVHRCRRPPSKKQRTVPGPATCWPPPAKPAPSSTRKENPRLPRARRMATSSTTASEHHPRDRNGRCRQRRLYLHRLRPHNPHPHPGRRRSPRPACTASTATPTPTRAPPPTATGHLYLRTRIYDPPPPALPPAILPTSSTATPTQHQPPQVHRPNRQYPHARRLDHLRRRHRHRPPRCRPCHSFRRHQPRPLPHQHRPPRRHHRPRHRPRHRRLRRLPPLGS